MSGNTVSTFLESTVVNGTENKDAILASSVSAESWRTTMTKLQDLRERQSEGETIERSLGS